MYSAPHTNSLSHSFFDALTQSVFYLRERCPWTMTFWVNRPPNAERTPKHCITKRKSSTEDRLLRRLKRLSGNRIGYIVCFVCFVFCCFYFVVFWFWTNNCIFPAFGETLFLGLLFLVISSSINNKLQQPMAAHGVLVYAMKNHGADVVRHLFIFWWSYDLYVV